MKIAMVTSAPFPPQCGIGNYVYNLSCGLRARGHEVIIVTRGGLRMQVFEYNKLVVYKLPFLMAYPLHVDIHGVFVNQFLDGLKDHLDIIHVHSPLTPALSTQIPIVTTFHTPLLPDSYASETVDIESLLGRILGVLAYRTEKSLISSSRLISAVSDSVASELQKYYGVKSEGIARLGNAVNDVYLERGREIVERKDDNLILYAGRVDYRKGVLDLVESMKVVTKKIPDAKLIIIGKGPLLSAVIRKIAELGLHESIEVKGFVSSKELLEISLRASIFVLPSYYEGLPTGILEAMACRLAVVATAVCGNIDIVRNCETGILVSPKAPKSLGKAIINLIEHPDLKLKLTNNARMLVEDNYTWDKVTERVLDFYNAAMR